MLQKNDFKAIVKSFSCAFKGINYCINNERNMRIHLCVSVLILIFAYFFKVDSTQLISLLLCIGFVITNEVMNTAIETLINLESPSYNNLAKIAKDVSAGAVFISAMISLIVGFVVFFKPKRLLDALILICTNPLYIALFLVIIVLSLLFVFRGPQMVKEPKTKIYKMKNNKFDKSNDSL